MHKINNNICPGRKPVLDLIRDDPLRCLKLFIGENVNIKFRDEIINLAKSHNIKFNIVKNDMLDKISNGENHQGVICELKTVKYFELDEFINNLKSERALIVILDHIEDPHNLGAIIRTAEAGGASCVIFPKDRAALPSGTVIKTSAGASLRLPLIQVVNINSAIEKLKNKNFWVLGLDEKSNINIYDEKFPDKTALIIGAEGSGISRLVKKNCDILLRIPIKSGGVGSLNASVAASLGIFEWTKESKNF